MSTLIYSSGSLAVGADTPLSTFDANWNVLTGGFNLTVRTATSDIRGATGGSDANRWVGTTVVDQRIILASLFSGASNSFPGLRVRTGTALGSGYLAQWNGGAGNITILRVTAGPTFTTIATGGVVANSTTYNHPFFKATGSGSSVLLEWGDDTNTGPFSFSDTNAARWTSGQPGLDIFETSTSFTCAFGTIQIFDEALTGHGILLAGQRNRSIV